MHGGRQRRTVAENGDHRGGRLVQLGIERCWVETQLCYMVLGMPRTFDPQGVVGDSAPLTHAQSGWGWCTQ